MWSIVSLVGGTVAILEKVVVSGFRYFGLTGIIRAHFTNIFGILQKEMNVLYLAPTVAHAALYKEMNVTAATTRFIGYVFEHSFGKEAVASKQYGVGDRFDELKVVGVPFLKMGKNCRTDHYGILVLRTGAFYDSCKFVSELVHVRDARNYGLSLSTRSKLFP